MSHPIALCTAQYPKNRPDLIYQFMFAWHLHLMQKEMVCKQHLDIERVNIGESLAKSSAVPSDVEFKMDAFTK